jgi:phosphonoacetaldehyde hydrolase
MNAPLRLSDFSLAIFDWAGTMVDFGCRAPVEALVTAFARHGVTLQETAARADMGKAKDVHVRALLARPEVAGVLGAGRKVVMSRISPRRLTHSLRIWVGTFSKSLSCDAVTAGRQS